MASLKDLKNKLSGVSNKKEPIEKNISSTPQSKLEPPSLEIEEARYLLALIAKSDFSGKDIQIVYDSALKLQEIIKNNLDTNG